MSNFAKTRVMPIWLLLALVFLTCQKVPYTRRRQLNLIPQGQLLSLSQEQYNAFLQENEVITGTEQGQMVERVGQRIQGAVEEYLQEHDLTERTEGFAWEYNLIASDQVNAFAMPGGKVGVLQGILPIASSENGLAVVMGHEIAHVIAEHGNERMSQVLLVQLGGLALNVALQEKPEQTQQLFLAAYGLGAQVGVILPYSRTHESEADKLGLILMAKAGYDPRAAVDFWTRMHESSEGAQPPEFLSTHPSHETRIQALKEFMPQAMEHYRNADQG